MLPRILAPALPGTLTGRVIAYRSGLNRTSQLTSLQVRCPLKWLRSSASYAARAQQLVMGYSAPAHLISKVVAQVQCFNCNCTVAGGHAPFALALLIILAHAPPGKLNSRIRYSYPFASKPHVANIYFSGSDSCWPLW
jgi:hypothetical protein